MTANQVDVDAGKLAEGKTQVQAAVKAFAQQMVTDHSGCQQAGGRPRHQAEGQAARTTPRHKACRKGGDDNLARLRTLDGAAFDKAYVEHEVAYHVAVLEALDKVLIPNASNAELKALLVKVRPAIDAHLQHARHLQADLK